jgi:hypothetical protein
LNENDPEGAARISDVVTFWTEYRDSIRNDNAADIIPTIKVMSNSFPI